MKHPLVRSVEDTIAREHLCSLDDCLYVALSGGSDSVALLLALIELGYRVRALHCNFRLRGEASDADEAFVKNLCQRLGISVETTSFETLRYAREQGLSIEMAARELRYSWFGEIHKQDPHTLIAIAHNAQDQVETLLLNLANGTGLRGLSGMPYRRENFIRPMMDVLPNDVIAYLHDQKQDWCHDESNDDEAYRRNYIRHTLIPTFGQVNGAFVENALRTINNLRGIEKFYREAIDKSIAEVQSGHSISIEALMQSAHPQTLLFEILRPYGFSGEQCRLIVDSLPQLPSGRNFYAPAYRLVRSWEVLEIVPIAQDLIEVVIEVVDGETIDTPWGALSMRLVPRHELTTLRCSPRVALVNWDKLQEEALGAVHLALRLPIEGERMRPLGLRGTKLISRIFIDKHVAHSQRMQTPLLLYGQVPLWLVGYTSSHDYRIMEDTNMVLVLTMSEAGDLKGC